MTSVTRRGADLPPFYIHRSWCQAGARYMFTVIDRARRDVARGTKPEGYDTEHAAQAALERRVT